MSSQRHGRNRPATPSSTPAVDRTTARYLFAITILSENGSDRVTTGELQEYLEITPASVTQMAAKLAERGLVDHEKYAGITLTREGEAIAARLNRRFCLVTKFFESVLDTSIDHQTALEIGHQFPEEGVARLRELTTVSCLDLCPESEGESDCCTA